MSVLPIKKVENVKNLKVDTVLNEFAKEKLIDLASEAELPAEVLDCDIDIDDEKIELLHIEAIVSPFDANSKTTKTTIIISNDLIGGDFVTFWGFEFRSNNFDSLPGEISNKHFKVNPYAIEAAVKDMQLTYTKDKRLASFTTIEILKVNGLIVDKYKLCFYYNENFYSTIGYSSNLEGCTFWGLLPNKDYRMEIEKSCLKKTKFLPFLGLASLVGTVFAFIGLNAGLTTFLLVLAIALFISRPVATHFLKKIEKNKVIENRISKLNNLLLKHKLESLTSEEIRKITEDLSKKLIIL